MELQELKNIWAEYDRKLDRNLHLNMQLLRQMNFDKVKNKLSKLLFFKVIEMIVFGSAVIYLGRFTVNNWSVPQLSVSAIIIGALFIVCFVYNIKQLSIIIQLQMGYNRAIAPIQKKIEQLKLMIVTYVKITLLLFPLYPVLLLLAGKVIFDMDFLDSKHRTYFLSNASVGLVLLILAFWFLRQLSSKNINSTAAKILLTGSGWYQANSAYKFLGEIEKFEQEA
jgi:hypothetical protein